MLPTRAGPPAGRASVVGFEAEPMSIAGAAGELVRIQVHYDPGTGTPGPASAIAKFRGRSATQCAMDEQLGLFARERRFYRDVAATLPVAVPRCYWAGDGSRLPLLLEDLRELRFVDQVRGLELGDAERLMDSLADLHAAFWEQPAPGGAEWLVSLSDPTFGGLLTQLLVSGLPALNARYAGRVPNSVLAEVTTAAPTWPEVLLRCAEGPRTLVHNDCRADNIFFAAGDEPVLLDWQLVAFARGTQDIAYLLSGSLQPQVLRDSWDALLSRYHRRLLALGVQGYTWQQCVEHYRQSVLYTLTPGIAMLGAMAIAGDERGLADALVLRTLLHAADLDAFEALR
ncbi:MAG TPA: phosphotransferase [Pseudonocardia sp.]|nr:phosphotransferase [Pseudonocardia sp.]